jgi:dTDP-glucose 4,6-dehydratase
MDEIKVSVCMVGWTPSKDFDAALEATVRWYAEKQAWVNRMTRGAYRRERLGLADKAA